MQKIKEIISKEIDNGVKYLGLNPWACGVGIKSTIFNLSDGRKAQIQISITADQDDFDDPTGEFFGKL